MPRLTPEAKDCINTLKDTLSNRGLADYLEEHNYGKYSQAAVGRYKKKMLDTLDTPEKIQVLEEFDRARELSEIGKGSEGLIWEEPKPPRKKRAPKILSFNQFMEKLEGSDSFTSKHLKEKLNAKGKYAKINKERYIRIIRDTLDVLEE